MTDDEINRRVAEIEGWESSGITWRRAKRDQNYGEVIEDRRTMPPYSTDWQWCGPLIAKYELDVFSLGDADGQGATMWGAETEKYGFDIDFSPQRAICLAVIAAHEDKPSGVWTGLGDK